MNYTTIDIDNLEDFYKLAEGLVVFADVQREGHDLLFFPAKTPYPLFLTCLCKEGAWKKEPPPNIKFIEATLESAR